MCSQAHGGAHNCLLTLVAEAGHSDAEARGKGNSGPRVTSPACPQGASPALWVSGRPLGWAEAGPSTRGPGGIGLASWVGRGCRGLWTRPPSGGCAPGAEPSAPLALRGLPAPGAGMGAPATEQAVCRPLRLWLPHRPQRPVGQSLLEQLPHSQGRLEGSGCPVLCRPVVAENCPQPSAGTFYTGRPLRRREGQVQAASP